MHNNEINLQELFYVIIKDWKVIMTSLFICLFVTFIYSNLFLSEEVYYETKASMVINSKIHTIIDGKIEINGINNVYLSQTMVNTYSIILISDNVLEKVIDNLGIDILPSVIRSWITMTSPADTEVIIVSVRNEDPQLAANIANSIMHVAPQVISETIEVGSINVLDEAKVPEFPLIVKKNSILNLVFVGILGLIVGVFIVMLLYYFRPKLKNKKEMLELLSLNCLGEIPQIKNKKYSNNQNLLITNANEINNPGFVEGYKTLMYMVNYESEKSDIKTLIVTSAVRGEGKTTMSVNLALSMALVGKKTLLIDFDCYRKSVMGLFGLNPNDIFDEDKPYSKWVIEDPKTGLHMIFSEKGDFFGMNMMDSLKIKEVFENMKSRYDYIIVDAPPVLVQSEAVSLSKYMDGVILVVKQETATIKDILEARDKIHDVGAKIIGGVLNDIRYLVGTEYGNRYSYKRYKMKNEKFN